jgi:hypothetical protein
VNDVKGVGNKSVLSTNRRRILVLSSNHWSISGVRERREDFLSKYKKFLNFSKVFIEDSCVS